eukprot:EST44697.1 Hypothetical protein SS50377_15409 [Spironucleus salmonicida]
MRSIRKTLARKQRQITDNEYGAPKLLPIAEDLPHLESLGTVCLDRDDNGDGTLLLGNRDISSQSMMQGPQ